jgi:hypothetical protein
MTQWDIEITDTFGDEANYSWVRRYRIEANTERGAINKLAKEYGAGWRKEYSTGDMSRYNLQGVCVCLLIEQSESQSC